MSEQLFTENAPLQRPYVILNMVESIDGRTTLNGSVGTLTGPADQEVVYALREQADALLVGAGTVRTERYASIVRGEPHDQPLVVIVTASGRLPEDLPLLHEPHTHVVLATATDSTLGFAHAATVDYLHIPNPNGNGVDLVWMCRELRRAYGVKTMVCEGGPMLYEGMLGARLVDELYLSLSPKIVGAGERTMLDGKLPGGPVDARLLSVRDTDGYVFLRYAL